MQRMHRLYILSSQIFAKYYSILRFLGKVIKRSVDEYIKKFKHLNPSGDYPKRSWVYEVAKSIHYDLSKTWLPKKKWKVLPIKSDEEASNPRKYNPIAEVCRKAMIFSKALAEIILKHKLFINDLIMDNGGENNLLHTIVNEYKLYNCHAYCFGEKGTLENKHRLIRRIIKKGESMDSHTQA
ncbi:MAG: hypothetical protein KAG14_02200, partial [Mycoplasmataceae bacterium]|nr:hypothetical protein [Mycoplasmataceae bacterium]